MSLAKIKLNTRGCFVLIYLTGSISFDHSVDSEVLDRAGGIYEGEIISHENERLSIRIKSGQDREFPDSALKAAVYREDFLSEQEYQKEIDKLKL